MNSDNWTVALRRSSDVAFARQAAMTAMTSIGASVIKKTKFVTAVSEIARNAVVYGHGGVMSFRVVGEGARKAVVAECSDRGPGIANVEQALQDGYTTGTGLGLGLSGARRLVDRFDIVSSADSGTIVTLESSAR